eukprot:NODE_558_length_6689_cov_0.361912.p4 type:complete len:141 gc:universal NODE_558_length_6689_cov_0.361912:5919-6341(+)
MDKYSQILRINGNLLYGLVSLPKIILKEEPYSATFEKQFGAYCSILGSFTTTSIEDLVSKIIFIRCSKLDIKLENTESDMFSSTEAAIASSKVFSNSGMAPFKQALLKWQMPTTCSLNPGILVLKVCKPLERMAVIQLEV